jgi:hypothetical protein
MLFKLLENQPSNAFKIVQKNIKKQKNHGVNDDINKNHTNDNKNVNNNNNNDLNVEKCISIAKNNFFRNQEIEHMAQKIFTFALNFKPTFVVLGSNSIDVHRVLNGGLQTNVNNENDDYEDDDINSNNNNINNNNNNNNNNNMDMEDDLNIDDANFFFVEKRFDAVIEWTPNFFPNYSGDDHNDKDSSFFITNKKNFNDDDNYDINIIKNENKKEIIVIYPFKLKLIELLLFNDTKQNLFVNNDNIKNKNKKNKQQVSFILSRK